MLAIASGVVGCQHVGSTSGSLIESYVADDIAVDTGTVKGKSIATLQDVEVELRGLVKSASGGSTHRAASDGRQTAPCGQRQLRNASIGWRNAPVQGAANWSDHTAREQGNTPDAQVPPPPKKRYARIPLRTVGEVHSEAARIYRLARSGQMDSADCSRLASVLALIARMIEGGELERRVRALEKRS